MKVKTGHLTGSEEEGMFFESEGAQAVLVFFKKNPQPKPAGI